MSAGCRFEGCTVGETGTCAFGRDLAACENLVAKVPGAADGLPAGGDVVPPGVPGAPGAPVLGRPVGPIPFPSSRTLGPEAISGLMARRYVTVVGVLGDPDSGKTACLASLYLLLSGARLDGWTYADSTSLMGFDDISRGARDWNEGRPPEQMTVHTEMADERRPGFLHLKLVRSSDGRRVDLALPDLPGEWTTALVATARSDRLEFLKSAEAVWVVVDGRALADIEKRQGAITRVGQLAGRLRTLAGPVLPRLLVVVTHRDRHELEQGTIGRLKGELDKRGAVADILQVAPLSDDERVKPGFGLAELIEATVGPPAEAPVFWPARQPGPGARSYLAYRVDR